MSTDERDNYFRTPERQVDPIDSSEDHRFDTRRSVRDSAERLRQKKMKNTKKKKKKKKKVRIIAEERVLKVMSCPSLKTQKSKRTLWVENAIMEHRKSQTPQSSTNPASSVPERLLCLENAVPRGSGFIEVKGGRLETPRPVRFMDSVHSQESRLNYRTTRSSRNRRRGLRNARQSNEMYESQKIHSRRSISRTSNNILPETKDAIQSQLRKGEPLVDVKPISMDDIEHREAINYWREFRRIRFYRSPTVTRVIGQILQTIIPEIGVTYQTIIDEFLGQSWPISIFLHGGLLRDIMTSTVGNDVDITFSCSHYEMKEICDDRGWKSEIREDIPYWVVGGASHFETKLEGFPLSFNGLAPFHVQDFASNTIYYDCKNNIIIDRYGKGVDAALRNQITLPCYSKEDWEQWKNCDFVPGVKMYRFYKFVVRGFGYDIEEAKYVQGSIAGYVAEDQEAAVKSCYHALRDLARGQDSYKEAVKYKDKLRRKVIQIYVRTYNAEESKGAEFWETYWEKTVDAAIAMGNFCDLELYEADPSEHDIHVNTIEEESDCAFGSAEGKPLIPDQLSSTLPPGNQPQHTRADANGMMDEISSNSTFGSENTTRQISNRCITGPIRIPKDVHVYKQSSLPSSPGSAYTVSASSSATTTSTTTTSTKSKGVGPGSDAGSHSNRSSKVMVEWCVNFPDE